jgi:hypothetical protein
MIPSNLVIGEIILSIIVDGTYRTIARVLYRSCIWIVNLSSGMRQLIFSPSLKKCSLQSLQVILFFHWQICTMVYSAVCAQRSTCIVFPSLPIRNNSTTMLRIFFSQYFQCLFLCNCVDTHQVKYSGIQLLACLCRIPHIHVVLLYFTVYNHWGTKSALSSSVLW